MATILYSREQQSPFGDGVQRVTWTPLTHLDVGDPYPVMGGTDKTVQIAGTIGSDDSVVWEGSLQATPVNWFTLRDGLGASLSITSAGQRGGPVVDGPLAWIRPRGVAGVASATSVTAILMLGSAR